MDCVRTAYGGRKTKNKKHAMLGNIGQAANGGGYIYDFLQFVVLR